MNELPTYKDELMRFNSFGELINREHLINLFNICFKNSSVYHVLYTKRMNLLEEFAHMKPDNLKIISKHIQNTPSIVFKRVTSAGYVILEGRLQSS